MKKLDSKLKTRWIRALRSGKYKQGRESLKVEENGQTRFCCLGVLCDIQGVTVFKKPNSFSHPAISHLLDYEVRTKLAHMNDGGITFKKIASYIEKHL